MFVTRPLSHQGFGGLTLQNYNVFETKAVFRQKTALFNFYRFTNRFVTIPSSV